MLQKLALVSVLSIILIFTISPVTDSDLWWHLASGRYIVENQIPTTDPFSYTNFGNPWVDHEWLAQVIFFFAYDLFDIVGPVLIKSIAVVLAFFILYQRARLHMGVPFSIATLYIAASLSWNAWLERPMIFTFFFTSLILFILDLYEKKGSDKLFIIPLATIIWVNLHGGFILAILITLIYSVGYLFAKERAKAKRLFLIAVASAAASMVNPYTYRLLLYPFQYSYQSVHTLFIQEWQSPSFHTPGVYEAMLLLVVFIFAKSRPTNVHLFLSLVFTHLSLFAIRNISLFALVVTPILMIYVEKYLLTVIGASERTREFDIIAVEQAVRKSGLSQDTKEKLLTRFMPSFLYAFVIFAFLIPFYNYLQVGPAFDTSPKEFPEQAVGHLLEQKPNGNLFNFYGWGGYIIWRAYPEYKVFIDGRADMYGDFVHEYIGVIRLGPAWRETLKKYDVSVILVPTEHPLDVLLKEVPEWREDYRDPMAVIYVLRE